jgi:hypothetical protein
VSKGGHRWDTKRPRRCMCCFKRRWVCVTTVLALVILVLVGVMVVLRYAFLPGFIAREMRKVRGACVACKWGARELTWPVALQQLPRANTRPVPTPPLHAGHSSHENRHTHTPPTLFPPGGMGAAHALPVGVIVAALSSLFKCVP